MGCSTKIEHKVQLNTDLYCQYVDEKNQHVYLYINLQYNILAVHTSSSPLKSPLLTIGTMYPILEINQSLHYFVSNCWTEIPVPQLQKKYKDYVAEKALLGDSVDE